jgi:hypothetical protein
MVSTVRPFAASAGRLLRNLRTAWGSLGHQR